VILSNDLRTGCCERSAGTPVALVNGRAVLLGSFISPVPLRLEGLLSAAPLHDLLYRCALWVEERAPFRRLSNGSQP
jgi:hypothetical protein